MGARVNRAWGFAFRKRFCRSFDFELQASADEDGIVLSLGPQHSFPVESLFGMLTPENGKALLEQALLAAPVFQTRWRWSVTRALAVLRNKNGQRVPPNLQRFRSDDLLAAVFPAQAGCLENHHGDTPIPDHPLIHQTFHDCLHEAMDVDRWLSLLGDIRTGQVELIARNTREPSPFSHEILNANPYAFLDGAPLEERRARAVTLRRRLLVRIGQRPRPTRSGSHRPSSSRGVAGGARCRRIARHAQLNVLAARRRSPRMETAFRRIGGDRPGNVREDAWRAG